MPDLSPLLTPRVAGLLLAFLVGCALAVSGYVACIVVLGAPEATASAIALAVQACLQALAVRGLAGPFRGAWLAHGACWAAAFGLAGLAGLSGGSAFFAVATAAFVVMPAGGLAAAGRAVTVRRGAS